MPNAAIDAPCSTPPILRMFVEPQVGHLGIFCSLGEEIVVIGSSL